MESALHRNTSVAHTTCKSPSIVSRPTVIHKSAYGREFGISTKVQDGPIASIHSTTSAFTPCYRKGGCPHTLAGQSRLSSFDFQDLQQQPAVLSGRLTSYQVEPREPAQKLQEMSQFSALYPGCQANGNPRCCSIRKDGFPGFCCQENHGRGQSDEDYQMDFGRGKHRTMPYVSRPHQTIHKPVFHTGQRLGIRPYYQPPHGATSEYCYELEVSSSSDTQESCDLRSQEIQVGNDLQEIGEQEGEQLEKSSYEEESQDVQCCTPLSRDETSGSFGKEYASEGLSSVNHNETQHEINGISQRKQNEWQSSREHGPSSCHNLCCRAPISRPHRHGDMSKNADYVKREMNKRAEHMSKHWTQNHQGGTTCLVCFKTLKRSYYMKSHMLIHTGDKPYKCAYCSKAFNQIGNRNAHQRIHTGEKPYACDYCGKRFIFNSSKHNHMKAHGHTSFSFPEDDFSDDESRNS
ncbi:zinc finger protein 530-like [Actinia tenebrosa]|uniref:Zinc finger protein 530-like n=1 Tax=Actinia tenebrosa TaxID=6105 RepID=A0A6P8IR73_ACTTE|nr:zinc finger protein 530-like [Actinia tenebrosa]XP_031569622.1 zinc finger protein 530-like [Actinia tenebrosa]